MKKLKINRDSRRLFELMHKSHENELDENEKIEINSMLRNSEDLRIAFLGFRDQHLFLNEKLKNRQVDDQVLGHLSVDNKKSSTNNLLIFLIFCSLIGIILFVFQSKNNEQKEIVNNEIKPFEQSHINYVASISSSVDTNNPKLKKGEDLKAGWLSLSNGKIILQMSSGMEISVDAPAKLELLNGNSLRLKHGKIRLQGTLGRKGFSVYTEYGKIIDQAADFGINIDSHSASTSCFNAQIAYVKDEKILLVTAGKSFDLIEQKYIKTEKYESVKNIRDEENLVVKHKLDSWRQFIYKLKYDPDTAFLYQFAPNKNNENQLIQEVNRSEVEPAHGKIIGATWAKGRFPGTKSLKFDSPNDRVKFFLNEKFEAMTLNMWLKIDHLTNNDHIGIFLSEKWDLNQITLQHIVQNQGSFFKVDSKNNFSYLSKFFEPNQVLGKWLLVSFTFDINEKKFHLYLNGKNIDRHIRLNPKKISPPFIGWCDLMNWVPINSQDIRNAPGKVDFLSIHRRAFSSQEIKEFYLISKTP